MGCIPEGLSLGEASELINRARAGRGVVDLAVKLAGDGRARRWSGWPDTVMGIVRRLHWSAWDDYRPWVPEWMKAEWRADQKAATVSREP